VVSYVEHVDFIINHFDL